MRPDVQYQYQEESTEARKQCEQRRARVLAWPDLAELLTRPPLSLPNPLMWSGYIPPTHWRDRINDSPVRKQLITICQLVAEREEKQRADPTPVAPELINNRQLTKLHICLNEYLCEKDADGVVVALPTRDEKLLYLQAETGRDFTVRKDASSKDLTKEEAIAIIDKLTQLVNLERREDQHHEMQAESVPRPGGRPDGQAGSDDGPTYPQGWYEDADGSAEDDTPVPDGWGGNTDEPPY